MPIEQKMDGELVQALEIQYFIEAIEYIFNYRSYRIS